MAITWILNGIGYQQQFKKPYGFLNSRRAK